MKFKNALEFALDGKAVMFAGSGYSYGAINIKRQPLKRGGELSKYFSNKCKLPIDTALDDAAESFIEDFGEDELINEIQNEFTVKSLASFHEKLAAIPWKRIYTTNYDNVLELSWTKASKRLTPITLSSDIYKIPKDQEICIHLNGFIDRLDRKTINTELKLTESSYLSASLTDSEWMVMFRNDIQLARAVFFLGYSLYDFDIKKILFDSNDLKDKCFFVIGTDPDAVTLRRSKRYGTPVKKTIEGFAKDVEKSYRSFKPSTPHEPVLLSIREYKPESNPAPITDQNFINLLLFGDVKRNLLLESLKTDKRYLLRREYSEKVFSSFDSGNPICLVSSDLGNGKSLFLENINFQGVKKGFRVFNVRERNEESIHEFEKLLEFPGKILVTIDGYQDWLDEIRSFSINSSQNKYLLLTARNALHDVLYDDLVDTTGRDYLPEIQIDYLTDTEISWFVEGFNEYGLWGDLASDTIDQKRRYLKQDCQGQIHSILLKLLDAPNISRRLRNIYDGLKSNPTYYEVAISAFILVTINHAININTLIDLWGPERISHIRRNKNSPIREIINFEQHNITLKSSIVGEYFLKNIADASIIVNVLLKLTNRVHDICSDSSKYFSIFKSLMKFGNVQLILPEEGMKAGIMKYYESIKTLKKCAMNPLFWLQYAIASIVIKDLFRAKKYFDSAYSYAEKKSWDTFQIDNHFARYLLLLSIEEITDPNEAMLNFRQAKNIINRQMANERLHYPYKVASLYYPFYERFSPSLNNSDIDLMKKTASTVLTKINALPDNRQKGRNIRDCKLAIECMLTSCNEKLNNDAPNKANSADAKCPKND